MGPGDLRIALEGLMDTQSLIDLGIRYGIRVVGVIIALVLGFWVAGRVGSLVRRSMERREIDTTLAGFAGNSTRWLVIILVGVACLGVFGIETTSFAAIIAAGGLAIGLAFQGTLSSVAGGVMLLVLRPFKAGDVVTVAGQTGKVMEIGLFATLLDTPDNRRLILPNNTVFGATIENKSFHEKRRVDLTVGVDYDADLQETRKVLEAVAEGVEGGDDFAVVLVSLGASSVDWQLRVWCAGADYFAVLEALTDATKRQLDAAGIGIPYPQMDVHIDGAVGQAA